MRLKSFHAKNMSEAMKIVRQALGDEAIIVATREEDGGGVRVTAAVEEDESYTAPRTAHAAAPKPPEPEVDVSEVVAETLHRHAVPAMLADQLVSVAAGVDTNDPALALASALDGAFAFQPFDDKRLPSRTLMLVGPSGGGKTLAVAKVAARAVLAGRSVGVITTDTVRAGGVGQLDAFLRILKLKLTSAEDPDALAGAVAVHEAANVVIIDTAGRNPFDVVDMDDLRQLIEISRVEPVLVLPAGLDAQEATDVALAFRALGVQRLFPSRLDAARRFGSLLVAAQRAKLSFSDASYAPKVAEGLAPLKPVTLARLMIHGDAKAPVSKVAHGAAPRQSARPSHPQSGPSRQPFVKPSSRTLP